MNFGATFKYSVIAATTFMLFSSFVAVAAPSNAELERVEKKVFQQSMEHKKLQAQATQIAMELSQVNKSLISSARQIQNNEAKLSQMEKQLEILESDLKIAQESFEKEDKNLIKTLAALQSLALKPTESLLVQPLGPVDIIRSAIILRETIPHLEVDAERIRGKLQDIEKKKTRVENQIAEISKQKKVMTSEYARIQKMVKYKSNLKNMVEIKSEKAKKNVDKLASQAQDLRDLLGKLEKQRLEKEKRLAEQRRKEELRKLEEKQSSDLIKSQSAAITSIASGFAKAKGSLPMPARGVIITKYGEQKTKGVSAKGITVATRTQAQVISPFDGTVIFADKFRGYGNMIIIEHDSGYLSLLSGLGSVDVELGQMLLAGEPVGQMPLSGAAELYIEIRKNNQPINPSAWFKI